jgi:hypothetical protein
VTAGESLHWMDWYRLMPRLAGLLVDGAYLAIIGRGEARTRWWDDLLALIQRYTTNRDYQPYNIVEELEKRSLFEQHGSESTAPVPVRQSVASYIESIHSRNGFSRDRMTAQAALDFDSHVARLLDSHATDGEVAFDVVGDVTWGRPLTPA